MTTQIKRRRGTTAEHASFTGAEGEITIDTTKDTAVVHDGATAGGHPLAKENGSTFTNVDINSGTIDGVTIGGASAGAGTFTTLGATGDVDIADKIVHTGDTNTAIRFPAADNVSVETAGSERMRINNDGNVGIGTTSIRLGERLHVLGQGIVTSSAENTNMGLFGTFGGNEQLIGSFNNIPVVFRTNNTERARIDSSGNVGIGTTSPAYKLDVNSGNVNAVARFESTDASAEIDIVDSGGYSRISNVNGNLLFQADRGNATASTTIEFDIDGSERLRIDSSGNLLVGTTSANGSTSNAKPVVAGAFRSLNGTLTSLANGTAYTMFTASADFATWMVNVHCIVSAVIYSETAIVQINNSSVRVDIISAGSGVAISNSGLDIQVTQTSGTTQSDLVWSAVKMA